MKKKTTTRNMTTWRRFAVCLLSYCFSVPFFLVAFLPPVNDNGALNNNGVLRPTTFEPTAPVQYNVVKSSSTGEEIQKGVGSYNLFQKARVLGQSWVLFS